MVFKVEGGGENTSVAIKHLCRQAERQAQDKGSRSVTKAEVPSPDTLHNRHTDFPDNPASRLTLRATQYNCNHFIPTELTFTTTTSTCHCCFGRGAGFNYTTSHPNVSEDRRATGTAKIYLP